MNIIQIIRILLLLLPLNAFSQYIYEVDASILNIRAGRGIEYEKIAGIPRGEVVEVFEIVDDWAEIETKEGVKGYVSFEYLKPNDSSPQEQEKSNEDNAPSDEGNDYLGIIFVSAILFYAIFSWTSPNSKNKKGKPKRSKNQKKSAKQNQRKAPVVMNKFLCKHCGNKDSSLRSLTFSSCHTSPTGKHQPFEGGEQEIYLCKHCGNKDSSLRSLTFSSCHTSPTGRHQPL